VTAIIIALLTAFGGLVVWFVKLIFLERYQFMDKIGDEPVKNPYVMIRLDRLTGAIDAFNWAGWVRVAPHSGYQGTETPGKTHHRWWQSATSILVIVLVLAGIGWQHYQIHQLKLDVAKAQRTGDFAIAADKLTQVLTNAVNDKLDAALHAR
jgi:hypothetical protein